MRTHVRGRTTKARPSTIMSDLIFWRSIVSRADTVRDYPTAGRSYMSILHHENMSFVHRERIQVTGKKRR